MFKLRIVIEDRNGGLNTIMKSVMIAGILALGATGIFAADSDDLRTDEKKAVLDAEQTYIDAALKHDTDTLAKLLRDDYIDVDTAGRARTGREVADIWEKNPSKIKEVDPKNRPTPTAIRVRLSGDVAIVTGGSTEPGPKGITTRFVRIWVKVNGQWKLTTNQLTKVEPLKPGPPVKIVLPSGGLQHMPPQPHKS